MPDIIQKYAEKLIELYEAKQKYEIRKELKVKK